MFRRDMIKSLGVGLLSVPFLKGNKVEAELPKPEEVKNSWIDEHLSKTFKGIQCSGTIPTGKPVDLSYEINRTSLDV